MSQILVLLRINAILDLLHTMHTVVIRLFVVKRLALLQDKNLALSEADQYLPSNCAALMLCSIRPLRQRATQWYVFF